MEKLVVVVVVCAIVVLVSAMTSGATQYMVGDSSGWDISTDLDTWATDKTFNTGDSLVFQYSSAHSVNEVTRQNFQSCNTTNVLQTFNSTGNNTVTLNKPGERFFVCGNKLHCLGGMKLSVKVENNNQSDAPVGAPQAATGSGRGTNSNHPNPSSKANKDIPSSAAPFNRLEMNCIGLRVLSFIYVIFTILL